MSFSTLRALHTIIGEALDDIETVFRDASATADSYDALRSPISPSPVPALGAPWEEPQAMRKMSVASASVLTPPPSGRVVGSGASSMTTTKLDWPSLDEAYYPAQHATSSAPTEERLSASPAVLAAVSRLVAACGQMSASVQRPFLTVCDAAMGYHLPACLRLLEAAHIPEILREAGPRGLHVEEIARRVGEVRRGISHVMRLLATHHITKEVRPDIFANNRVSSAMDSGRSIEELMTTPDGKYEGTNGIAAFVGLCTDELFKSAAYLTDCYLPDAEAPEADTAPSSDGTKQPEHLMHAPFNLAFRTDAPYFQWLETHENQARFKRFGKAMTGTSAWEVPGAVVSGFPWHSLSQDSVVVDVGGGIGSTSLMLAHAFPHLRFLVQDRPQVATMGESAWRDRCPQFLETGRAAFQGHDFFGPQPAWPTSLRETSGRPASEDVPAVFLLRVITHDWPDLYVTRILLHLRRAAGPDTKLLLADWVLPLACIDEDSDPGSPRQGLSMLDKMRVPALPGTVRTLAPEGSPLLPNLGKANANAYWLDLTMRVTFNSHERTLREMAALTLTAGWRIVRVTRAEGSLFGHIIAVPTDIPRENLPLLDAPLPAQTPLVDVEGQSSKSLTVSRDTDPSSTATEMTKSPEMGDTFCSSVALPSDEDVRKVVKAGRKAAQGWQVRASEWRQRLVKKSSAMWRDRKNSAVQEQIPPIPLATGLPVELLPAAELGMGALKASNADVVGAEGIGHAGPGRTGKMDELRVCENDEKDRKKVSGLRKVFSRAQLNVGEHR
ncbi:S-adenosyl-L-methionine-dependent methyltransferase [Fomitopsis betulina]|nr:S-adenosyl-L-methionine-dependent methyltransferase [Fomitopsis betulina]